MNGRPSLDCLKSWLWASPPFVNTRRDSSPPRRKLKSGERLSQSAVLASLPLHSGLLKNLMKYCSERPLKMQCREIKVQYLFLKFVAITKRYRYQGQMSVPLHKALRPGRACSCSAIM